MPAIETNFDSCSCLLETTSRLHAVTRSFSTCHACECELSVCLDPDPGLGLQLTAPLEATRCLACCQKVIQHTHHACLFYDILVQQRRRLALILVPSAPCLMQSHAVTT